MALQAIALSMIDSAIHQYNPGRPEEVSTCEGEAMFFPVERIVYPRSDDFLNEELQISRDSAVFKRYRRTWGLLP